MPIIIFVSMSLTQWTSFPVVVAKVETIMTMMMTMVIIEIYRRDCRGKASESDTIATQKLFKLLMWKSQGKTELSGGKLNRTGNSRQVFPDE